MKELLKKGIRASKVGIWKFIRRHDVYNKNKDLEYAQK